MRGRWGSLLGWGIASTRASKRRVSSRRNSYPAERATTPRRETMRERVPVTCHQRKTRQRFSVFQVKSIYWGLREVSSGS